MGSPRIEPKTRLEKFFQKHEIPPDVLKPYRIGRAQLLRYRTGAASPRVKTARLIIMALNRLGYKCKANDLFALDDQ